MRKRNEGSQEWKARAAAGIRRADRALNGYRILPEHPRSASAIADLLADLRHWCDADGLEYAEMDREGQRLYLSDLGGMAK